MSIEQLIAENTAALRELTTVMRSGNTASTEVAPTDAKATKGTRKSANNPNESASMEGNFVKGDTKYYHIPKHKSVVAVRPGDTTPSIEGTVEISGDEYTKLKAEYDKPMSTVVPFAKLTERVTVLSKIANGGREAVKALLTKYLPDSEKPKFPELEKLEDKRVLILADIEVAITKLETPPPAEATIEDDLGLT